MSASRQVEGIKSIGGTMRRRPFFTTLVTITLGGLAFRVGYILLVTRYQNGKLYDWLWYELTSVELAKGQFFLQPFTLQPTATHPPLTSILLMPANYLFGGYHVGTLPERLTMALLGAIVVYLVGLVGARLAGPWVGLVAAVLAAFSPDFWMPSGILMAETPAMLCTALVFLSIIRLRRAPTMGNVALVGLTCALDALARPELVLFIPFLLVPAALARRPYPGRAPTPPSSDAGDPQPPARPYPDPGGHPNPPSSGAGDPQPLARPYTIPLGRRLGLVGVGLVVSALVLAPWVGRNLATFKDPTYLTSGDGTLLLGANCPETYYGSGTGFWSVPCSVAVKSSGDESVVSAADQQAAVRYAKHHLGRLPAVVAARIGREWGFFKPIATAEVDVNEGRPIPASLAGLSVYYLLLAPMVGGIVVFRRARIPQWFLLVPAGVLTVVAAATYGLVRFRAPFEVGMVVLAAGGLVAAVDWLRRRAGRGRGAGRHSAAHARRAEPLSAA